MSAMPLLPVSSQSCYSWREEGVYKTSEVKKIHAIKVINTSTERLAFLDLDSARFTIRPIPDGVEGSGGLPAKLELAHEQNPYSFVKLMNVLKFQDARMFSSTLCSSLFTCQLPLIAMFCNDSVINFIKTLADTPDRILSFIQTIGDDGDYKWIAPKQLNELLTTFIGYKRSDTKKLECISPHLKSYVFEHSQIVLTVEQKRPRLF